MQFVLAKKQKISLLEQAREQLLTALHTGGLRPGDRLPSVRQVAVSNGINIKTAFSIYRRLREEEYIELRAGSGAYVSDRERADLDQAYCLTILRLIRSNLSQASHLKLDEHQYCEIVKNFVDRSRLRSAELAVIECNEEQTNLFARELSDRLKARVSPVLLSELDRPDGATARLLARMDYFVTTDFHFKQVKESISGYQKKIFQVRLDPAFVPALVEAARSGGLLMVVTNANYFPAFCNNLTKVGVPDAILNRITAVDDSDLDRVRAAAELVKTVYVSPICDPRVRDVIPGLLEELEFDKVLSQESIEALEAVVLFHS